MTYCELNGQNKENKKIYDYQNARSNVWFQFFSCALTVNRVNGGDNSLKWPNIFDAFRLRLKNIIRFMFKKKEIPK